jgi:hypothetical protein
LFFDSTDWQLGRVKGDPTGLASQERKLQSMPTAREVALRVNGVRTADARVRRVQKGLELVITDPRLGEFVADENFTLELLELVHLQEIRRSLPNGGWRKVSLRVLIALLRSGVVHVADES